MKRLLLPLFLLTVAAMSSTNAPAQTIDLKGQLSRVGGTYLYDPAAKRPVLALTYRTASLTDVLGRKGLDLDLSAIGGASGSGASLGMGLLFAKNVRFSLSNELKGTLGLTVGLALLYATGGGNMRLGTVPGVAFRF